MKTRILAMLLALAMIVTVFAACGGETASTSTSTSTSVSESKPADDTDEEKTAKAEARKALGIGYANLSRTQLINQQNTWFKEKSVTTSLGATMKPYEEYQEDYVNNRRPIEIIPGYAASGLVTGFERYEELSEILDDVTQTDYVQRAFFAETEEAKQILNDYITKVTTEKDGLYLQFLDWVAENVVGSRDDLAW